MMIDEIIAAEDCTIRSKVQTRDFKYVKLAIIPVQEAIMTPFLYDVGEGRVFGAGVMVDVYFFDSEDRRDLIENLAANLFISAFPWFRYLVFPRTAGKALKSADYVILNPRMSLGKMSFKYAMLDQAQFFSTVGENINKYASKTAWITVVSPSYTSVFCHLLKMKMKDFPPNRITGLKLHIQALATNMIAHRLDVPPDNVKGVTVWGENILDFQMATVDTIPKIRIVVDDEYLKIHCKTYYEFQLRRQGIIVAEEQIQRTLCKLNSGGLDKNHSCKYCQSVNYRKQTEFEAEAFLYESSDSECECTPEAARNKPEQVALEKCKTVKELQDEMISKIATFLNSRRSKKEKVAKLEEKELLEKYQAYCPVVTAEPNYQLDDNGNLTNILPLTHFIEDHYWLLKNLPKVCLKASAKSGLAIAQSLTRHISNLHKGTKKPFSITTCVDDAYDFPRGVYTSGPGAVDEGTGCVAFFPLYEMSENTQLKLFRQILKLKKQFRLLETNFWAAEEEALDRKMMPLIEKNELGIAPFAFTGEHLRQMGSSKSVFGRGFFDEPPQTDQWLSDMVKWHQSLKQKVLAKELNEGNQAKNDPQKSTAPSKSEILDKEMSGVYDNFI